MGREARVKKERHIRGRDEVVYADAQGVKEGADLFRRAAAVGLVLPSVIDPAKLLADEE